MLKSMFIYDMIYTKILLKRDMIMEFNERLQELRKQKGFTQEELAAALYVSRTAISKWESGRGYPNIDSLKAIAKVFSVSLDDLLSGEEMLTIAEEDNKRSVNGFRDLIFGLLDVCTLLLVFLPFFAQRIDGKIHEVSLMNLTEAAVYLKTIYLILVIATAGWGVLVLAFQNYQGRYWVLFKSKISLVLSTIGAFAFILSLQPYAAIFLFSFLIIKVFLLLKK